MIQDSTTDEMKTMADVVNKLVVNGYTEDFKAGEQGLLSLQTEHLYRAHDVKVVNFYRFEGASDPGDNAILYAIETCDGVKGTLVDGYGPYSDAIVQKFMQEVDEVNKKGANHDSRAN